MAVGKPSHEGEFLGGERGHGLGGLSIEFELFDQALHNGPVVQALLVEIERCPPGKRKIFEAIGRSS